MVCKAFCADKKTEVEYRLKGSNVYYFYLIVQTEDENNHKVMVGEDFFNRKEFGAELLIIGNRLTEGEDKIYHAYFPVR